MLKTHRVYEHQTLSWGEFSCAERVRKALIQLDEKDSFKPFLFTAYGIKARHFVGVVSLGGEVIEVLPKVFASDADGFDAQKRLNTTGLMYLLTLSETLKISELDMARLSRQFDSLLEVFIYFFAHQLFELLNNDFKANYVQQTENLNFVKGRIEFTHHLRHNHTNQAKFYCQYDEYDGNILLNQILKATVRKCLSATKAHFAILRKCDHLLSSIDSKRFTNPNVCKQVIFTRLNQNYQHVFELAKLLLFGNSPHLSSEDLNTFSIMFDMNKLFEEAVYRVIVGNQNQWKINQVSTQKPEKKMFDGHSVNFTMKPDIYIEFCDSQKMIIDVKYKQLDVIKSAYQSTQKGVSQADIYQLFAYAQYYQAQRCLLLYPQFDQNLPSAQLKQDDPKFELGIAFVNLIISEKGYTEYVNGLSNQIKTMIEYRNQINECEHGHY